MRKKKATINLDAYLTEKEAGKNAEMLVMLAAFESLTQITQEINSVLEKIADFAENSAAAKEMIEDATQKVVNKEPAKIEAIRHLLDLHSKNLMFIARAIEEVCEEAEFTEEVKNKASAMIESLSDEHQKKSHYIDHYLDLIIDSMKVSVRE